MMVQEEWGKINALPFSSYYLHAAAVFQNTELGFQRKASYPHTRPHPASLWIYIAHASKELQAPNTYLIHPDMNTAGDTARVRSMICTLGARLGGAALSPWRSSWGTSESARELYKIPVSRLQPHLL